MRNKFGKDNISSKVIYRYDLNGKYIDKHYGASEIERNFNFNQGNIRKAIKNKWCMYNYCWSYKYFGLCWNKHPKRRDRSKTKKSVLMFNLKGELLKEFDSIKSANNYFNKKSSHITHHLKGRYKTCYGHIFKYKK